MTTSGRTRRRTREPKVIGWRERVSLPEFGITRIKAKIDTGALTSALHAFRPRYSQQEDGEWISFEIHPRRRSTKDSVRVSARVKSHKWIRSSNGKREMRPVITMKIGLGDDEWDAEFTLTNRKLMAYRMILGRSALRGRFIVDSGRSYQLHFGD